MNQPNATEQKPLPQPRKTGPTHKVLRLAIVSIGGLLVTLIAIIVIVVAFGIPIDLSWLRGRIEVTASEALGRSFTIRGPLTLVPTVPPAAQIEGVHVGNPEGWQEGDLAHLNLARARLRILPLLKGEVLIEEITVDGLQVHLQTNSEGEPNWLLKASQEESKPEKKEAAPALRFIELVQLSLRNIVVTHRDVASDKTFEFKLNEITGNAEDRKPMRLLIAGSVQQVPYEVKFNGGSLAALVDGSEPWPLDFVAKAVGAKLAITGEIAEPLRGRGLALDFDFTGPMMKDLEVILGTALPAIRSFGLRGRIEEVAGKYRIADLEGEVAKTGLIGNFEADLTGARPRLHGAIDVQSIDAGPLFAAISEAKSIQAEEGRQPEQLVEQSHDKAADRPTETVEMLDLDEPILTLEPLKKF